jgi:hypothetical protein
MNMHTPCGGGGNLMNQTSNYFIGEEGIWAYIPIEK